MAIDSNDIRLLTQAITQAIRQSGGPQHHERWNPVSSRVNGEGSPEERANSIKSSKYLEDNNKLTKELNRLLASNQRSTSDLSRFTEVHRKTLDKAINSYKNIDDSTKELTKQLTKQLSSQDATTQTISKLAGGIKKLEDVLAFSDLGKQMSALSKSIDANSDSSAEEVVEAVGKLEQTIKRNGGNGVQDISADLKKFTDEIARIAQITRSATAADVANGGATHTGQQIRDAAEINRQTAALRASNQYRAAQEQLRDLALAAQTRGIEANIAVTRRSSGMLATSNSRLAAWTARVASSAFVLDQLAAAGKQLYTTLKTAGGTGTDKSLLGVIKRDLSSFANGVSPDVIQETQVKGARTRASLGKDNFDKSVLDGISNLVGITYDRNEAAKMQEQLLSNLSRSGIGADQTKLTAASNGLRESFLKLQVMTGMTGEQMAALTTEIAADTSFRQGLMTLNEKERAATVAGITKMFEENAQRNISVEQTKSMIKAQQALSDATSPKTRIKNAAKLKALGGAYGMDMTDASELVLASGNQELMKKRLMSRGLSAEQADAKVKNAQLSREAFGTRVEKDLSDNGAVGLTAEALLNQTGTKDWALSAGQTLNEAGKLQKEAADKMMAAAIKMGEVNVGTNVIDGITNSLGTMTGKIIAAALAAGALYLFRSKLPGIVGPALGGLLQRVAPRISNRLGITGTVANGMTGVAPAAVAAAGTAGVVGQAGGAAANAAGGAARITPVAGAVGTVGPIGGAAANAASAGGGAFSRLAKGLGKIAAPLAVASALFEGGDALMNAKGAEAKGAGVGKAIGAGAGGWYGAGAGATAGGLTGAAIGSVVPIIGTAIGGIAGTIIGGGLGALGGGWAGGGIGGWLGGKAGGMFGQSSSPAHPAITPAVNTAVREEAKKAEDQKAAADKAQKKDAPAKEDPNVTLQKSLVEMNTTLGLILDALNTQTEEMATDTDKHLAMQQRMHRAMKSRGFAGTTPADGTVSAYKAA